MLAAIPTPRGYRFRDERCNIPRRNAHREDRLITKAPHPRLAEIPGRPATTRCRTRAYLLNALLVAALFSGAGCGATYTPPPASTQIRQASWIARPAIYEVFTRDFSPEGNFTGLINGLDRVQ